MLHEKPEPNALNGSADQPSAGQLFLHCSSVPEALKATLGSSVSRCDCALRQKPVAFKSMRIILTDIVSGATTRH